MTDHAPFEDEDDPDTERYRRHREAIDVLHVGGIQHAVGMPRHLAKSAIRRLTNCLEHDASHVFVVDQSRAYPHGGVVHIGVSEHGLACLKKAGIVP